MADEDQRVAHFASLVDLAAAAGREVAVGRWLTLNQPRIDGFADVTGDHQWITWMSSGRGHRLSAAPLRMVFW